VPGEFQSLLTQPVQCTIEATLAKPSPKKPASRANPHNRFPTAEWSTSLSVIRQVDVLRVVPVLLIAPPE